MATLTPTLTLASSDALVDTLALSVTDSLNITGQSQLGKKLMTGSLVTVFAAASFGESMVYLRNLSTSGGDKRASEKIIIAFAAAEEIHIGPGEFALFPWESGADLKAKFSGGAAPYLEYGIFEF